MNPQPHSRALLICLLSALLLAAPGMSAAGTEASPPAETGLVRRIVDAPVVPDGLVAGRPTDFVIDLDAELDPRVPGRTLRAGGTIRVTLPGAFTRDPAVPFATLFGDPTCQPLHVVCNTVFLLQGWPQHPVGFPPSTMPELWTVDFDESSRTVIVTARQDLPADPPGEPGIKQIHLLLAGFTNPPPGEYEVSVVAETGADGAPETGTGQLIIRERGQPAIAIACAFNEGAPNTLYQATSPGTATPLPYDLLLWDEAGEPLLDVTVRQTGPNHALLVSGDRTLGTVEIEAPPGATTQEVRASAPSIAANSPVVGAPAGRLTVLFTAGETPGEYVLRFGLTSGNVVEVFVTVQ